MTDTDEKILTAIKNQFHVGEGRQEMLYTSYMNLKSDPGFSLSPLILCFIAKDIEPSNGGKLRNIPAVLDGAWVAHPENLVKEVWDWISSFNSARKSIDDNGWYDIDGGNWFSDKDRIEVADAVIKGYLDIHPFSDGNRRIAWLLRVWLLNQWHSPEPLPNYYN